MEGGLRHGLPPASETGTDVPPSFAPGLTRPGSGLYDLSGVKAVDSFEHPELKLRLLLMAIGTGALAWAFSLVWIIAWFALYAAAHLSYIRYVARQPVVVPEKQARRVAMFLLVDGALFTALGIYFWTMPEPVFRLLSLLMVIGAMIDVLSNRSRDTLMVWVGMVVNVVSLTARIGWLWWADGASVETFTVSIFLGLVCVYFINAVQSVQRGNRDLADRQLQLMEQEKQRSIDRLAGGFAHDFNNLLTAVMGNLELQRQVHSDVERDELITEAHKAALRGAELTEWLLAFSHKARLKPRLVSPGALLSEVDAAVTPELTAGNRLEIIAEDGLPDLEVDPEKMCLVLAGLALNADDALEEPGPIRLEAHHSHGRDGLDVTFAVTDRGCGIPERMIPMVFEPYFTTKPKGTAHGLGLSMAKGIVEQCGGEIEITSTEGRGTTVRVHLPAALQSDMQKT